MFTPIRLLIRLKPSKLAITKGSKKIERIPLFFQIQEYIFKCEGSFRYHFYTTSSNDGSDSEAVLNKLEQTGSTKCRDEQNFLAKQFEILDSLRKFGEDFLMPEVDEYVKEDNFVEDGLKKNSKHEYDLEPSTVSMPVIMKKQLVHNLQQNYNKKFTSLADNILELQMRNMSSGKTTPSIRIPIPNPNVDNQNTSDCVVLNITINIPVNELQKQRDDSIKLLQEGNDMSKQKAVIIENEDKQSTSTKLSCYQKLDLSISKSLSKLGFGDKNLLGIKQNVQKSSSLILIKKQQEQDLKETKEKQDSCTDESKTKKNLPIVNEVKLINNTQPETLKKSYKLQECRKNYIDEKRKNLDMHIKDIFKNQLNLPDKTDKNTTNKNIADHKSIQSVKNLNISTPDLEKDKSPVLNNNKNEIYTKSFPSEKQGIFRHLIRKRPELNENNVNIEKKQTLTKIKRTVDKEDVFPSLNKTSKVLLEKQNQLPKIKLANLKQLEDSTYREKNDTYSSNIFAEKQNLSIKEEKIEIKNINDDFKCPSKTESLKPQTEVENKLPEVNAIILPQKEKINELTVDKQEQEQPFCKSEIDPCPKSYSDLYNKSDNSDKRKINKERLKSKDIINNKPTEVFDVIYERLSEESVKETDLKLPKNDLNTIENDEILINTIKQSSEKITKLEMTQNKVQDNLETTQNKIQNTNKKSLPEKEKKKFLDWRNRCRDIVYPEDEMFDNPVVKYDKIFSNVSNRKSEKDFGDKSNQRNVNNEQNMINNFNPIFSNHLVDTTEKNSENVKSEKLLRLSKLAELTSDTKFKTQLKKRAAHKPVISNKVMKRIKTEPRSINSLQTKKEAIKSLLNENLTEDLIDNSSLIQNSLNSSFPSPDYQINKRMKDLAEVRESDINTQMIKQIQSLNNKNEFTSEMKKEEIIAVKTAEFTKILLELVKVFSLSAMKDIERASRGNQFSQLKNKNITEIPKLHNSPLRSHSISVNKRELGLGSSDESPLRKKCGPNIDDSPFSKLDKE